jgi:hypothetical protein
MTCDRIRYESSKADTNLRRMVLLCNTLDLTIWLSQEVSFSTDIHDTGGEESECERSPIASVIDDLYELEDFEAHIHPLLESRARDL